MTRSEAITELYALFGAPHNADINLTRLNKLLDELTEFPPAQQEPVAWVCNGTNGHHDIDFFEEDVDSISVGTQLYTTPPQRKPPQFPTMLRKMWSGAEVQKWINENWEQA